MNCDRTISKAKIWLVENTQASFPDLEARLEERGYKVRYVSSKTYFHLNESCERPDYILCGQPLDGHSACQACKSRQASDRAITIPLFCLHEALQNPTCDWQETTAPQIPPSLWETVLAWLERENNKMLPSQPHRDRQTRLEAENQQLRRELQRSRQAEEQLLQERTHLLEAQKVSGAGSWEFDAIARTMVWSQEAFRIFGLDPQQSPPTYAHFLDSLHLEDRERFQTLQEQTLALGRSGEIELRIVRASGEVRYIFLKIQPILNPAGQLLRWVGTVMDISERKEAERERDLFFTYSPDLLCIADFSGKFKRLSPSWEKVLGYSLEELGAKPFLEFIHPDDRENTQKVYAKILAGEAVRDFTNRYCDKNGNYHWLEWTAIPFQPGNSIYAIARDISDRILAEAALKKSEAQYKRLIESSPDLIYALSDRRGGIYYSPSIESILGYSLPYLYTHPQLWLDSLHPEDRSRVETAIANCFQGQDFEMEYPHSRC
jgi:PAS domain S-box-containing protein